MHCICLFEVQYSLNPLISLSSFMASARKLACQAPNDMHINLSDDLGIVSGVDAHSNSVGTLVGLSLLGSLCFQSG